MKDLKILLMAIFLFAIIFSCQKFEKNEIDTPNSNEEQTTMQDIVVPAGFDWSMTTDYEFYLSGGSGGTIEISSEDGNVIYHKGTYIEENGSYKVSLRLPSSVNTVKINSASVELNGATINHSLSTKSSEINYSLYFDGVDDLVDLGDITELNNTATFTIEGWTNQSTNTNPEFIFYKRPDVNNDLMLYTSGGAMIVDVGNGSNTWATWANYSATISSGTWFHWAIVYDGSGASNADKLKLFINGNTTPITLSFTGTIPSTTSASLAGNNATLSEITAHFNGYMDEVRVWSIARTATEIHDNYHVLLVGNEAGLVAYYQCDEGSGTTLGDLAENYDGTISGATYSTEVSYATDSDLDGVDDNYDDYENDLLRAYDNYYPAAGFGTVAFEDLWPGMGDYDFNDFVIGYQFKTVTNASNEVVEIFADFEVRAHGAQLDNGFGFQLPDAVAGILSDVEVSGYSHTQGIITIDGTTKFESGQTFPVVIVMDKVADLMDKFENTIDWKPPVPYVPITITMTVASGTYSASDFSVETWDPFMFINQVRGHEVHKIDITPTDLVNPGYFGTAQDVSVPGNNEYYRTVRGLPWVLEFPTVFEWPREKVDINWAYHYFREWAESGGTEKLDWYTNTSLEYRLDANIY